jgi:hypothetical protein
LQREATATSTASETCSHASSSSGKRRPRSPAASSAPSRKRRHPPGRTKANDTQVAPSPPTSSTQVTGSLHNPDPAQTTPGQLLPLAEMPLAEFSDTQPQLHSTTAEVPPRKRQATLHAWLSRHPSAKPPPAEDPPTQRGPAHGRATEGPPT